MSWSSKDQYHSKYYREEKRKLRPITDGVINQIEGEEKMSTKERDEKQVAVFKNEIQQMSQQFGIVLPPGVTQERFVRILQSAVMANPMFARGNKTSFFKAAMECAKDGLLPDGKEAAIVQMGGEAAYLPMINGILKRIYESGRVKSVVSEIIYANDEFDYEILPEGPYLRHKPVILGDKGAKIGVYAVAYLTSGGIVPELIPAADIEALKADLKRKSGPWVGIHEGEMWRKTALRKLSKKLPMDKPCNIETETSSISPVTGEIIEEKASAIEAPKEEK